MDYRILIVDDERIVRNSLKRLLQQPDCEILTVDSGGEALRYLRKFHPDLMILDYKLGDMDGLQVLKEAKKVSTDLVVIMITAYGTIPLAVEAMKEGVYDFLEKEAAPDMVRFVVQRALDTIRLRKQIEALRKEWMQERGLDPIVAESEAMQQVMRLAGEYAQSDSTLLLWGETGTGKSLIAEWIHCKSQRFSGPFVTINCGAIPKELIESELFGYEKGAFTGADTRGKKGLIEKAHGGTLLLDEISELPLNLQSKLLQVLERGEFFRIGATEPTRVDVRFMAATNANLSKLVEEKAFRMDLFYRINVASLYIPPLRERKEDILPLAYYFVDQFNRKFQKQVREIRKKAQSLLLSYHWPGNVRELRNVIERIMILKKNDVIEAGDLVTLQDSERNNLCLDESLSVPWGSGKNVLQEVNKRLIERALEMTHSNKTNASALLGIPRTTLHFYIKRFGLGK